MIVDPECDLSPGDAANMIAFLLGLAGSSIAVVEPDPDVLAVLAPFLEQADGKRITVASTVLVAEAIHHMNLTPMSR